jgi:hypothetical protein
MTHDDDYHYGERDECDNDDGCDEVDFSRRASLASLSPSPPTYDDGKEGEAVTATTAGPGPSMISTTVAMGGWTSSTNDDGGRPMMMEGASDTTPYPRHHESANSSSCGSRSGGDAIDGHPRDEDDEVMMASLVGLSDILETTHEGDGEDDGRQRTKSSPSFDDDGGMAKVEEVAHSSLRSPHGMTTNDGVDGDYISTSMILPTLTTTKKTTTWNGGDNVASSSIMMVSLNLSEINEESADDGGGIIGGGVHANDKRRMMTNTAAEYDDERTSCNGNAAMVSMSLSGIVSADENDHDDIYRDDDHYDEATAGEEEGGCAIIGHSSSSGLRIDDDLTVDPIVDLAHYASEDDIADTSIFVCITEDIVPRLLGSERGGDISHVPSAPQCNEGGMLVGAIVKNDVDDVCDRGDDVRIAEEQMTDRLGSGDYIMPPSARQCNEGGTIERGCMRGDGVVVADGETTMQIAANMPSPMAEVWSGNDGIVMRDSVRKEGPRMVDIDGDDISTVESNAGVDVMNNERERHHEIWMNEADDLSTSGKTDADHVTRDIKVGFIVDIDGLHRDDEANDSGIIVKWPSSIPRSPSFGSMSSNDASTDDSQFSHSEVEDVFAGMDEYLPSYQPIIDRQRRATTLSECLAAVQDYLLDSPNWNAEVVEEPTLNDPFARLFARDRKSDVEEDLSPRDQLILKYQCHAGAAEDEVR